MKYPNMECNITCITCGFITLNPVDMLKHLAGIQKSEEENCKEMLIEFLPLEKREE